MLVSFIFASCAELSALGKEKDYLAARLEQATKVAFDKPVTDAVEASELIEQAKSLSESDPMPHMDAFDALVELSKAIPASIKHDIDEFDMQRGHVKLTAMVDSTSDASLVLEKVGEHRCVNNAKIAKITQQVNSTRQKYVLEYDVKCPDDEGAKKKKEGEAKEGEAATDAPAADGKETP